MKPHASETSVFRAAAERPGMGLAFRRSAIYVALLLSSLSASVGGALAAETSQATTPQGGPVATASALTVQFGLPSPYRFSVTGDAGQKAASAEIPVTLKKELAGKTPKPVAIGLVHRSTGRTIPAGRVALSISAAEKPGYPSALVVTVPLAAMPATDRFGAYELRAQLWTDEQQWQDLQIVIDYPESTLAPSERVVVEVNDYIIGSAVSVRPASMWLRLNDGPPLADARAFQAASALSGTVPVDGVLAAAGIPTVSRDEPAKVAVTVRDAFPRGESTGQLLVVAPDMKPVAVPFTVKVRAHSWLILLFAFAGILMGMIFRTGLTRLIEHRRAQAQLGQVQADLDRERDLRADTPFRQDLNRLNGDLTRISALLNAPKSDVAEVNSGIKQVQDGLADAIKASETRRRELADREAAVRAVVTARWRMPQPLKNVLAEKAGALAAVAPQIGSHRLDDAGATLDAIVRDLQKAAADWSDAHVNGRHQLDALRKPDCSWPLSLAPHVTKVLEELDAVNMTGAAGADVEGLRVLFGRIDLVTAASQKLHALIASVAETGRVVANGAPPSDPAGPAAIRQAVEELRGFDEEQYLARLPAGYADLARLAVAILAACRSLILSLVQTKSEGRKTAVKDLLKAGQYRAAVELAMEPEAPPMDPAAGVIRLGPSMPETRTMSILGRGRGATPVVEPGAPVLPDGGGPTLMAAEALRLVSTPAPERVRIDVPRTRTAIFMAQLAQTAFSTVALSLLAYPVFAPSFVGTFQDVAAVLGWGFTLDVGVGGVIQQLQTRRS